MIDVWHDCCSDAGGRDPDSHSATLREYHRILWSKPLPGGDRFDLDTSGPKPFLVHRSHLGEFHLTSDRISHRYRNRKQLWEYVDDLPDDLRAYATGSAWNVAECIVFPGRMIDRKKTINGARGLHSRIGDRFDLTLECIRRFYLAEGSPLAEDLARYSDFFTLFGSFQGYVEFFFLQDLVDQDFSHVRFFLPFRDFADSPFPHDLATYQALLRGAADFASGRASRMESWCEQAP
jgi:hypothetical protein